MTTWKVHELDLNGIDVLCKLVSMITIGLFFLPKSPPAKVDTALVEKEEDEGKLTDDTTKESTNHLEGIHLEIMEMKCVLPVQMPIGCLYYCLPKTPPTKLEREPVEKHEDDHELTNMLKFIATEMRKKWNKQLEEGVHSPNTKKKAYQDPPKKPCMQESLSILLDISCLNF